MGWDLLGLGMPGFRSWVRAIKRRARGGCFGLKSANRAVGARFSRTMCGRARSFVVWSLLGGFNPQFGFCVCAIKQRARGGCFGLKSANQAVGAQLSRTTC